MNKSTCWETDLRLSCFIHYLQARLFPPVAYITFPIWNGLIASKTAGKRNAVNPWILLTQQIWVLLHVSTLPDLEKKLQDLNQTKEDKAEQLRQLEEQVIAIKNEITEQESKYATCKS